MTISHPSLPRLSLPSDARPTSVSFYRLRDELGRARNRRHVARVLVVGAAIAAAVAGYHAAELISEVPSTQRSVPASTGIPLR